MQSLDISRMSDEELRTYLRGILKGEAVLNVVHDDVPSTRVLSLHQSQVDVRQKDRITAAISTILAEDFIGEVQVRLDARDDEFLADLAFLCESLKITESYRLLRALLDRGTHVPGENFFYQKNTERIILRALVVLQPPYLLIDTIWRIYWNSDDDFFWDVAFFGIRRSNLQLAISLLPDAYLRWRENRKMDFPQALYGILKTEMSREDFVKLRNVLGQVPSDDIVRIQSILEAKGISVDTRTMVFPPVYTLDTIRQRSKDTIHIYYHRDLDGVSATVTLMLYLAQEYGRKAKGIATIPVDFDKKAIWQDYDVKQPSAILDFLYHPKALIYYDHHKKPFVNKGFEDSFNLRRQGKLFRLQRGGSSTTKLVFDDLIEFFRGRFSGQFEMIQQMVAETDGIDRARFADVDEWLRSGTPTGKLNRILNQVKDDDFYNKVIQDLCHKDIDTVLARPEYQRILVEAEERQAWEVESVRRILERDNDVVIYDSAIDKAVPSYPVFRLLGYKFYPEALFTVGIYKKMSHYEVSVGKNPWKPGIPDIDVGSLCISLGGGGHDDVGGVTLKTYEEAKMVSRAIIDSLKKTTSARGELAGAS